jgi:hypothetical protein
MSQFGHLLSQTTFKFLVPFFVYIPQGVKYTSPPILRIDYKYNPVAHNSFVAPLTQCILEEFKYMKKS